MGVAGGPTVNLEFSCSEFCENTWQTAVGPSVSDSGASVNYRLNFSPAPNVTIPAAQLCTHYRSEGRPSS